MVMANKTKYSVKAVKWPYLEQGEGWPQYADAAYVIVDDLGIWQKMNGKYIRFEFERDANFFCQGANL